MACFRSIPKQKLWISYFVLGNLLFLIYCQDTELGSIFACDVSRNRAFEDLPFCNASLPMEDRISDLVQRLTLQEKLAMLGDSASGVERLGIPPYEWWNEALHGVTKSPGVRFGGEIPGATSFPQVILTAATFNTTLWNAIGQVVSTEARAMYNAGRAGLTYWSPNVNIFRDPRWGRGQETPGEDPLVVSKYAAYFVRGLQGQAYTDDEDIDPQAESSSSVGQIARNENNTSFEATHFLKVSACCKHFTAYDLDNWKGYDRYHFNAEVTEQDLEETYQPPFKSCIRNGLASSLMCSFNSVNGVPNCADRCLLTDLARNTWGFDGYIVSDCGAVDSMYDMFGYSASPEDAVADVLQAGLDVDCGWNVRQHVEAAIKRGAVNESAINVALTNSLRVQMRLGLFDGDPQAQPYGSLGFESICTDEHQELALEAARQGIVLLKNDDSRLPLPRSETLLVAVVGPNANASTVMLGDCGGTLLPTRLCFGPEYPARTAEKDVDLHLHLFALHDAGIACRVITPLEALKEYTAILHAPGCSDPSCLNDNRSGDPSCLHDSPSDIYQAVAAAKVADAVVIIVGLNQAVENVDVDRTDLLLPDNQQHLIQVIANSTDKTIVLVVMSGGPVDVSAQKDDKRIPCILWVGYPGQEGGTAIAQTIFGDHNPGGRLPMTWYPQAFVDVSMADMHMHANVSTGFPGRSYRFYTGQTVYGFGHGVSYSVFQYMFRDSTRTVHFSTHKEMQFDQFGRLGLSSRGQESSSKTQLFCDEMSFEVGIVVKNCGPRDGATVVLLYFVPPSYVDGVPLKQLIAFRRVFLKAESALEVIFIIEPCAHLSTILPSGDRVLNEGLHTLIVENEVQTVFIW